MNATNSPDARTGIQTPENDSATVHVSLSVPTAADDHPAVQEGDPIADHEAADNARYVEGEIQTTYGDEKYLILTDSGHELIVTDTQVYVFDGDEDLGRPVYQVTADPDDFEGEETTDMGGESISDLCSRFQDEDEEDDDEDEPVVMTDGGVVTEPQTYTFQSEDDAADPDLTFTVTDSWENRYGDQKAAVQTPAPWDVPDDADVDADPNEVVKELEWEDYHYTFDGDDREAWTLDVDGLKPLAEIAQAAGYEWEGRARSEDDDSESEAQAALRELAGDAQEGDRIKVEYLKKNGNGTNTYKGEVTLAQVGESERERNEFDWDEARTRTHSTGIVYTDENGKTKRVKTDDDGTPGHFSAGYHPFMGVLTEVTLIR